MFNSTRSKDSLVPAGLSSQNLHLHDTRGEWQTYGTLTCKVSRVWEATEACAVSLPLYSSCEDQSMIAACILYCMFSISLMESPYML